MLKAIQKRKISRRIGIQYWNVIPPTANSPILGMSALGQKRTSSHFVLSPRRRASSSLLLQSFYVYHPTAFGPTAIIYMLSCSRGGMINAILTLCGPPPSCVINLSLISLLARRLSTVVRGALYDVQTRSCCTGDDAPTRHFWHIR